MGLKVFLVAGFLSCSIVSFSQPNKSAEKCDGACCKKDSTLSSVINPTVILEMEKKKEVRCKLTTPELRKRKEEIIGSLKVKIQQRLELKDGYRYRFEGSDKNVDEVIAFIKSERLCCDFFSFQLSLEEQDLWLTITGPDGAKEFIKSEIDF